MMRYLMWVALIIVGMIAVQLAGCSQATDYTAEVDRHKMLAGELRDNKLYDAAITEYQKLLALPGMDNKRHANINYLIGRIYFENLSDYQSAAACYVRARALDPDGTFMPELSRNLVTSLERMGRRLDASRQMAAVTDLDYQPEEAGDIVVARVGGKPVYRSEVVEHIQSLPPEMQKRFDTPGSRIEYLHQYVGVEVLHRAALRENYNSDPEIARQMQLVEKKLLVDKYVRDNVMPRVKIDTADVHNFYLARKDQIYQGASYDSVRERVFLDYQTVKTEAAFSEYIEELARVEKIEFFDERMK